MYNSILNNTDVRLEPEDSTCKYKPFGTNLECALVRFLFDNDQDVYQQFIKRNRTQLKIV